MDCVLHKKINKRASLKLLKNYFCCLSFNSHYTLFYNCLKKLDLAVQMCFVCPIKDIRTISFN